MDFQEEGKIETPIPSLFAKEISDGLTRLETQMVQVLAAIGQIRDHDIRLTKLEARLDSMDFHNFKEESKEDRRVVRSLLESFRSDWRVANQSQFDRIQNIEKNLNEIDKEAEEKDKQLTALSSRLIRMEKWKAVIIGGALVIMFFLGRIAGSYIDNLINPQNITIQVPQKDTTLPIPKVSNPLQK